MNRFRRLSASFKWLLSNPHRLASASLKESELRDDRHDGQSGWLVESGTVGRPELSRS